MASQAEGLQGLQLHRYSHSGPSGPGLVLAFPGRAKTIAIQTNHALSASSHPVLAFPNELSGHRAFPRHSGRFVH